MGWPRLVVLAGIACVLLACGQRFARAESFVLKNGGHIEGDLLNPKRASADPYQVRTTEGVHLSLARDQVAKVIAKREVVSEYERQLPKVADTAAAHWEMAEWCREAGLRSQREFHLTRVVALEPEHEKAHLALGHQRWDGKWQKTDDYMSSHGYVKHQGKWRTRQDVELMKSKGAYNDEVIEWRKQIDIWRGWIGKKREAEAYGNIQAIRNPHAVPTLIDILENKSTPRELRMLIIDVLGQMQGNPGEGVFTKIAINEASDAGLRDACLDQLVRSQSKFAVFQFIAVLKTDKVSNDLVRRAGIGLQRLKDPIAAPTLIESLTTTHEEIITPQSSGGGLGPIQANSAGGFSAGAPKAVKIKRPIDNDTVLGALTTLYPGTNFGFNKDAWKKWYLAKHEPPKVDLRRVE